MDRETVKLALPESVACERHGEGELWVVCVHDEKIEQAVVHAEKLDGVTGEAVCGECRRGLDEGRWAEVQPSLRVGCGVCVRARWKISNAN